MLETATFSLNTRKKTTTIEIWIYKWDRTNSTRTSTRLFLTSIIQHCYSSLYPSAALMLYLVETHVFVVCLHGNWAGFRCHAPPLAWQLKKMTRGFEAISTSRSGAFVYLLTRRQQKCVKRGRRAEHADTAANLLWLISRARVTMVALFVAKLSMSFQRASLWALSFKDVQRQKKNWILNKFIFSFSNYAFVAGI